jgi:hypothetical protein
MIMIPPLSSPSQMGRGTARRVVEGSLAPSTDPDLGPSVGFAATSPQLRCREELR